MFVKCYSNLSHHQFFFGAETLWLGYCSAVLQRHRRLIPSELVTFVGREQDPVCGGFLLILPPCWGIEDPERRATMAPTHHCR